MKNFQRELAFKKIVKALPPLDQTAGLPPLDDGRTRFGDWALGGAVNAQQQAIYLVLYTEADIEFMPTGQGTLDVIFSGDCHEDVTLRDFRDMFGATLTTQEMGLMNTVYAAMY